MIESFGDKLARTSAEVFPFDALKGKVNTALEAYAQEKKLLPSTVEKIKGIIAEVPTPGTLGQDSVAGIDVISAAIRDAFPEDSSNDTVLARLFAANLINNVQ